MSEHTAGPLDLLVLQPTPFCNIDCSYCYLPNRQSTRRIGTAVLDRVFAEVFAAGIVRGPFTVVWHAGEPLVLPPVFYEGAFALLNRYNTAGVPVRHSFQTNATLLDDDWADFIRARELGVGVSVDGPAFLHDRCRKTRRGEGTLARVLEGMRRLRERDIPFHVITVLTRASLDCPDELFDFYVANGVRRVGFNVEEIEGPNTSSSLNAPYIRAALTHFLSRFYDLAERADPPLCVREFDGARGVLLHGLDSPPADNQSVPLAIVNVDCDGNFGTFSPELLGLPTSHYTSFALGNILTDSLAESVNSPRLQTMWRDIRAGIDRCRKSCTYFNWCGGGAPVNKYFENGSFDSTETMFCRLSRQAVVDVVLEKLERRRSLPLAPNVGDRSPMALSGLAESC
jgi:uncharacterized protein